MSDFAKLTDVEVAAECDRAVNVLAKWRQVFAGWQLGTRLKADPESDAVRHHREATIILRAEVTALTKCLIDAGVFTSRKFTEALAIEARQLSADFESKFPGMRADEKGIVYTLPEAAKTMEGWKP